MDKHTDENLIGKVIILKDGMKGRVYGITPTVYLIMYGKGGRIQAVYPDEVLEVENDG